MVIRKLEACEHERTRCLYEEIFPEDTKAFLDYYYRVCAVQNEIFVWETDDGEIVSMLHLNPYRIRIGKMETTVNYVVAVATRKTYRGRGLMRGLLLKAMEYLTVQKQTFTFLMPAAEAIYTPYGFRFISTQEQCILKEEERGLFAAETGQDKRQKTGDFQIRKAELTDLPDLSAFADKRLRNCGAAALHTEEYFLKMMEEQTCQNGELALVFQGEKICGYFFTAREEEKLEVREAVADESCSTRLISWIREYAGEDGQVQIYGMLPESAGSDRSGDCKRVPLMMGRILCLERFVSALSSSQEISLTLEMTDPLIHSNQGLFRLSLDRQGGKLIRLKERKEQRTEAFRLEIHQFVQLAFGYREPEELGACESFCTAWKSVQTFAPVFLNEVV